MHSSVGPDELDVLVLRDMRETSGSEEGGSGEAEVGAMDTQRVRQTIEWLAGRLVTRPPLTQRRGGHARWIGVHRADPETASAGC